MRKRCGSQDRAAGKASSLSMPAAWPHLAKRKQQRRAGRPTLAAGDVTLRARTKSMDGASHPQPPETTAPPP
eukprot:3460698-Prymnesium_polylepis.1